MVEPFTDLRSRLSASAILSTTKCGIAPLTCPASSMNRGFESALLRLPRQVERVDRNAVAAEARARVERHEAERLGRRRVDDLPHVDAEPSHISAISLTSADVDRAERVLEQLDHLGDLRRADRHDASRSPRA